jgi:hypothetical protein
MNLVWILAYARMTAKDVSGFVGAVCDRENAANLATSFGAASPSYKFKFSKFLPASARLTLASMRLAANSSVAVLSASVAW